MTKTTQPGTLHLVATPIGNMEDITIRALRILKESDLIAAEDTRRTQKLLSHYGISRPLISYYEHNEEKRIPTLLKALLAGRNVAVVSDAGSPGINDPGYRLVRQAVAQGLPVTGIPGPSSLVLSLSLSGLPSDRFTFYGFLPRTRAGRKKLLTDISQVPHTLLFFESPHRIIKSLEQILEVLGNREAAFCRELTKRFEQIERGKVAELIEKLKARPPKGEFCLVVEGKQIKEDQETEKQDKLQKAMALLKDIKDKPLKEAAREIAQKQGLSRREVYQLALQERSEKKK